MKILFGIQGTGNGHISRARMMARYLNDSDIEVRYLFSGRIFSDYFDMDIFGDCLYRRGLTFYSKNGGIDYRKTIVKNNLLAFYREVADLDVESYDCILTDFEPVSAWAGKLKKIPVVGIGHQYAFNYDVPRLGGNILSNNIMRYFSPAKISLGLHWHHFNRAILPPIIDPKIKRIDHNNPPRVLVYLPFENQDLVVDMLSKINNYHFVVYSPDLKDAENGCISLRKSCLEGFKKDLQLSSAVVCNAGFELISECLYLGVPVLAKPMHGQVEQLSNMAALDKLGLAETNLHLSEEIICNWLANLVHRDPIGYPDVAKRVVEWLACGRLESPTALSQQLWKDCLSDVAPS